MANGYVLDAVSDAQVTVDGAMDSGSTTLTSAAGLFTKKDKNKTISVQSAGGVGGSNQPLVTTIVAFVSSTQVTLADAATQTVSGQGVIWGTDNMAAFQAWAALLGKRGVIPAGNYLLNTKGNTQSITLNSNTTIAMDRGGAIYYVGASLNGGGPFIEISPGTRNLTLDSLHIIGEWKNTSTMAGISLGYGYGAAIMFNGGMTAISHVTIRNSLFENLMGVGISSFDYLDYDITIDHNSFENVGNTAVNVNSDFTSVTNNFFRNGAGSMECSGAYSLYADNTSVNAGGQYAMAFGGRTAGSPALGSVIARNRVVSPQGTGAFSIGDGFSSGIIAHNFCSLSGTNKFGLVIHQDGPVATTSNVLESNIVVAPGTIGGNTGNIGFYVTNVRDNIFRNNYTEETMFIGASLNNSNGNNSTQNHWNNLSIDNNSSGRFKDYVSSGTFSLTRGSTVSYDTVIDGPSGIVYPTA